MDELEKEILELGARAKLHQLESDKAELIERYPFLADVSPAPRFASLIEDARRFRDAQPPRAYRNYDEAFKQDALKRLQDGEYLSDVARDVKVTAQLLSVWAKKAGIRIAEMSREEASRRMRIGREGGSMLALPAPARAVPAKKVRTKPKSSGSSPKSNGSTQIAQEKGRAILRAMPDGVGGASGQPIHLDEIAKKTNVRKDNVNWRLGRRAKAGHVKKLDDPPATWVKTAKGLAWQNEVPGP